MAADDVRHPRIVLGAVGPRGGVCGAQAVDRAEEGEPALLSDYFPRPLPVAGGFGLGVAQVEAADFVQKLRLAVSGGERGGVAGVHGAVLGAHRDERADVPENQHHDGHKRQQKVERDLSATHPHHRPPVM